MWSNSPSRDAYPCINAVVLIYIWWDKINDHIQPGLLGRSEYLKHGKFIIYDDINYRMNRPNYVQDRASSQTDSARLGLLQAHLSSWLVLELCSTPTKIRKYILFNYSTCILVYILIFTTFFLYHFSWSGLGFFINGNLLFIGLPTYIVIN